MKAARVKLPPLTVTHDDLPHLDGGAALNVIAPLSADMLVNSDVWRAAHQAAPRLFPDYDEAMAQHAACVHAIGLSPREESRLEEAEWAQWSRLLQAAYIVGLAVGRRLGGAPGPEREWRKEEAPRANRNFDRRLAEARQLRQ